ncbi:MAG: ATP-dependent RecD-like DNA helicase [Fibrobacteraceae bacterium]|nr:ATP-dependent RecD-like DNA helicase [Fibrobacteraceae bacterium]
MKLEVTVKKVTFYNPQNGFSVLRVTENENQKATVVTGIFPELNVGDNLILEGNWTRHPKFGQQFSCISFELKENPTNNMVDYLANGNFPGIGQKTAENLVEIFGESLSEILDNHPDEFRSRISELSIAKKIKGFGPKKVELFMARWQENRRGRATMLFLYSHGITGTAAKKLWMGYGESTIEKIRENPYMLCEEIYSIGFVKADEIALKVGIAKDSPLRIEAALLYTLQEASMGEGHVYLPRRELLNNTFRNLRFGTNDDDAINGILNGFDNLCSQKRILTEGDDCYYPFIYRAEENIAENIRFRMYTKLPIMENFDRELVDFERRQNFAFDPIQRKAIAMALCHKISIITGGPGTGKTTILKGILHLAQKLDEVVMLTAPTGRAAKRMGTLSGVEARTIHRLLEVDPVTKKFGKNADSRLLCDLLIVDEFSMVDVWLSAALLDAVPDRARIVLVGDKDQLPSVGPGNVLNDLLRVEEIPSIKLEHIFRQAGDNDIASKAARINAGLLPTPIEGPNFHFIPYETPEEGKELVKDLLLGGINKKMDLQTLDLRQDLQILTPMRKGPMGIHELNGFLQDLLNPDVPRQKILGMNFSVGDRVMQLKNNYDKVIFNGDIGFVSRIDKAKQKVTIAYDLRNVEYEFDEMDQVTLAYASTIHKSQGSEYPAVIVILDSSHYNMLQRNLIYTAVTRAKGHVWILSAPGAFHQAVRNNRTSRRYTKLTERITNSSITPTGL